MGKALHSFKRDDGTWSRTIDRRHTVEYNAFNNAKSRCKPDYEHHKDYGDRGIKFPFESFDEFMEELGPRSDGRQLDRKDNDGHYESGNVRWTTRSTNVKNRRCRSKAGALGIIKGTSWMPSLKFAVPLTFDKEVVRKFFENLPEREAIQRKVDKEFYGEVE